MPLKRINDQVYGRRHLLVGDASTIRWRRLRFPNALELNHSRGSRFSNLDFLGQVESLRLLAVIHLALETTRGIGALDDALERLTISSYDPHPIDFSGWARLHHCSLHWRPGSESVFDCVSLESLHIDRSQIIAASELAALTNLKELQLTGARRLSRLDFAPTTPLQSLRLGYAFALQSFDGIQAVEGLEKLLVEASGVIPDLSPFRELRHLRVLSISDSQSVATLKPLAGHPTLEEVYFWGTTNVLDGDVQVLRTLPRLRKVAFANRKHYNARAEDLVFEA